ncbi:MAG: steroid 5-alpha reductase [Anaerolineae bacterium SM23_84]|jgi:steroid 5-alpha reductase family enzyme|nr:MAG: steroid 5-alpha reductase [Anaerolineae bacterium SM23_84]
MEIWSTLATVALIVFVYMSLLFVVALIRKRNDIADVGWGLGFILVAVSSLLLNGNVTPRKTLILVLVVLWGLRLAIHIGMRNRGKKEDYRYKKWREDWGDSWVIRSYLQVFLLQGVFMLMITFPLMIAMTYDQRPLGILDWLGVAVWAIGFFFEAVGDYQLTQFVSDPANRGKIMRYGLWRYTRHPNYFGEVTQWWGVFLIVLSVPNAWMGIIGPLTISLLILKVSGIPLLEKQFEGNPEWEEYKNRTSVFFPWFPKAA